MNAYEIRAKFKVGGEVYAVYPEPRYYTDTGEFFNYWKVTEIPISIVKEIEIRIDKNNITMYYHIQDADGSTPPKRARATDVFATLKEAENKATEENKKESERVRR